MFKYFFKIIIFSYFIFINKNINCTTTNDDEEDFDLKVTESDNLQLSESFFKNLLPKFMEFFLNEAFLPVIEEMIKQAGKQESKQVLYPSSAYNPQEIKHFTYPSSAYNPQDIKHFSHLSNAYNPEDSLYAYQDYYLNGVSQKYPLKFNRGIQYNDPGYLIKNSMITSNNSKRTKEDKNNYKSESQGQFFDPLTYVMRGRVLDIAPYYVRIN